MTSKKKTEERAALEHWHAEQQVEKQRRKNTPPKWGTPAAKRQEIERVRQEIANRKKR